MSGKHQKDYYAHHREEILAKAKEKYKDPEFKRKRREYEERTKETLKAYHNEYMRKWREENKERYHEYQRTYQKAYRELGKKTTE